MSLIKVCMLSPEFLPVWGGVGTYIVELIRHFPKSVEFHVVAPWRDSICKQSISSKDYDLADYFGNNVHVHYISNASDTFFYNGKFQFACLRHVPKLVKEEGIDLIHSHTAQMPDLLLQLRKLNVPTLTTIHTTIRGQKQGIRFSGASFGELELSERNTLSAYPFLRLAEDIYFSIGKNFMTVSKWSRKQIQKQYPGKGLSSIPVIYNSVDPKHFLRRPKSFNHSSQDTVLFTGRLAAIKGIRFIIKAIPKVISEHSKTRFVFIGPGDPTPYKNMLRRAGVSEKNFSFLGYFKESQDLAKYYQTCSIYLAPTLYETLGIRILEAMACEAPVVASNICAIPEIIQSDKNGILVSPRSSEDLASAICRLLEDSRLQRKIGLEARNTVETRFSWEVNVMRMFELYKKITKL